MFYGVQFLLVACRVELLTDPVQLLLGVVKVGCTSAVSDGEVSSKPVYSEIISCRWVPSRVTFSLEALNLSAAIVQSFAIESERQIDLRQTRRALLKALMMIVRTLQG